MCGFVVGDASSETDAAMRVSLEITHNALGSGKMSFQWRNSVTTQAHDGMGNVRCDTKRWSIARHQIKLWNWMVSSGVQGVEESNSG